MNNVKTHKISFSFSPLKLVSSNNKILKNLRILSSRGGLVGRASASFEVSSSSGESNPLREVYMVKNSD